jgi:hypothetical protein
VIPLTFRDSPDPAYPWFPIPRLLVAGLFEPWQLPPDGRTVFDAAFIDTAAPYVIIPHALHRSGLIRIYNDLGPQPYRVLSMGTQTVWQPFAEVGIRFLVMKPSPRYRPDSFAMVKAYLLEQGVTPTGRVVIGLDAIRSHFRLYVGQAGAFLLESGDAVP